MRPTEASSTTSCVTTWRWPSTSASRAASLLLAAVAGVSLLPAARAAGVDVTAALWSE